MRIPPTIFLGRIVPMGIAHVILIAKLSSEIYMNRITGYVKSETLFCSHHFQGNIFCARRGEHVGLDYISILTNRQLSCS